jgi:hypothetical protein
MYIFWDYLVIDRYWLSISINFFDKLEADT